MLKVFIGFDKSEIAAYQVCSYSIIKHCSEPVAIIPLNIRALPWLKNTDYKASTEFAFSRFAVPYLCDYEGQALFMDCDMLVTEDIANILKPKTALPVSVVKHEYKPDMRDKFLGQQQTDYKMKNWSSVMLFNNELCKALSPTYLNKASGLALHQFEWVEGRIGTLGPRWNYLVGEKTEHGEIADPAIIHYTKGGPYFKDYAKCDYSGLWWDYWEEANSVLDRRVIDNV